MSTSVCTVKTELNNDTLYRYCTSTAGYQLNTVKQQHTSTAASILTTKSTRTYRSLSVQRLSERTILSPSVLLWMGIVSKQTCRENKITFYVQYLYIRQSYRVWDYGEICVYGQTGHRWQCNRANTHCICWLTKATYTHSEYFILIDFPLQQWLHRRASLLHYSTLPIL
jgi:hypothetical protein